MAFYSSPKDAAPELHIERNKNTSSRARSRVCAVDYMLWMNCSLGEHLGMKLFIQKKCCVPGFPMISHIYPWASTIVLGGTRWCYRARPLPDVYGGALGEASGTVSFHLCEQGRPQGASFSAGDLSLHSRHQSSTQFGDRVSFDETAGARMHRRRSHGRDA